MPQLIGRVVMNHRGAYNSSTEYSLLDAVQYQGSSYTYINQQPSTGKVPTNTEYWELLAKEGDAATIQIGKVIGGPAGSAPIVTNVGDTWNAKFDFTLPKGDKGDAATIQVGTVTTGAAGTNALISNVGTTGDAKFNFTIPRGAVPTIELGSVSTGIAGSNVIITNTGTPEAAKFNFTLPRGDVPTISLGDVVTGPAGGNVVITNTGTPTAAKFNFNIPRGAIPTVSIGTVVTGEPGTQAIVTNTGTPEAAKFNFTIPRGDTGKIERGAADDLWVNFDESKTREPLTSGDDLTTSFGKLSKWYTDLKSIAFGEPITYTLSFIRNTGNSDLGDPLDMNVNLLTDYRQLFDIAVQDRGTPSLDRTTLRIENRRGGSNDNALQLTRTRDGVSSFWHVYHSGSSAGLIPLSKIGGSGNLVTSNSGGLDITGSHGNFIFKSTATTSNHWSITSSSGTIVGRIYNDANRGLPGMILENGYWGITRPNYTYDWIRFPGGIIPNSAAAKGSGVQQIGSTTWYWKDIYADNHYGVWQGDVLTAAKIPNLDAGKITSGTFAEARIPTLTAAKIPNLDAGKITSGTFAEARIPTLTAAKIPNLDAGKITSGFLGSGSLISKLFTQRGTIAGLQNVACFDESAGVYQGRHIPVTDLQQKMTGISSLLLNTSGVNSVPNQIARTQGNGYLMCGYINTNVNTESQAISRVFFETGNDGYIRKCTTDHLAYHAGLLKGIRILVTQSLGPSTNLVLPTTIASGGTLTFGVPSGISANNIRGVILYTNGGSSFVCAGYSSSGIIFRNVSGGNVSISSFSNYYMNIAYQA